MAMRIPTSLPRKRRSIEFKVEAERLYDGLDKFVALLFEQAIDDDMVPVAGTDEWEIINADPVKFVYDIELSIETIDWPQGAASIKYVTEDGYVEWRSTPRSKSGTS